MPRTRYSRSRTGGNSRVDPGRPGTRSGKNARCRLRLHSIAITGSIGPEWIGQHPLNLSTSSRPEQTPAGPAARAVTEPDQVRHLPRINAGDHPRRSKSTFNIAMSASAYLDTPESSHSGCNDLINRPARATLVSAERSWPARRRGRREGALRRRGRVRGGRSRGAHRDRCAARPNTRGHMRIAYSTSSPTNSSSSPVSILVGGS